MKRIILPVLILCTIAVFGFVNSTPENNEAVATCDVPKEVNRIITNATTNESIQFAISHGHCNLPITATISKSRVSSREPNFSDLEIDLTIEATSMIAAGDAENEFTANLHSKDAFHVKQHPLIEFKSNGNYPLGNNWYNLSGELTMAGVTQPVYLRTVPVYDANGNLKQFMLEGEVDLYDFNIDDNKDNPFYHEEKPMLIHAVVNVAGC